MATVSIRGQRTRVEQTDKEQPDKAAGFSPKQMWRGRRRLLIVLAGLAIVVWLLPAIVVHTPLFRWILGKATADLNGTLTVQSASLGWFSPIAVGGVEVKDAQGKSVLTLPAASGDRSLVAILCNYTNLGTFTLDRPKVSILLRDDGSNVEDVLAKYLAPQPTSSPMKIGLALKVVDGSVSVSEQLTGQGWQVSKLEVTFDMSQGTAGPMKGEVSADLTDAKHPGNLSAGVEMASAGNKATLSAKQIPLALFRPLLARFAPGTKLSGWLSSTLGVSWGGTAGKYSVQADATADGLSLSTPSLQGDTLQLDRLHAVSQVSWQGQRVEIQKTQVDCDLGTVSLESTLQLGDNGGLSLGTMLSQQYELRGQVDLARLARLLPASLHLRQQVQINSGQATLALSSRPGQQGMAWDGQFDVANLTATTGNGPVTWDRPISVTLKAHENPAGPIIDTLNCESDFFKMHANGTLDALAASLTFNLKLLADRLGQFIELGTIQIAGQGSGSLNWKRTPQQFDADAALQLNDLQLGPASQPWWREADLAARLSARGQTDFSAETRIDAAAISVKAGADQLDLQLAEPVKDLRNGGTWALGVKAQGQLQNWPARLAAWWPSTTGQFAGAYLLEVQGVASSDRVDLRQARLAVAPLIVTSTWLNVNEPRVDAAVSGSWDQQQRRLRIDPASLTCATVAVNANNFVLATPQTGAMELSGTIGCQGDVARLRRWFSNPAQAPAWQLAGQLRATAQLQPAAGAIRGDVAADVANLAVIDATNQQFQEPAVHLAARGDYNHQTGTLQLDQLELTSDALTAKAGGRIAPVSGVNEGQFTAQIGYDLERLSALGRPWLGPKISLTGKGTSAASYRGPFSLNTGSAAANLRWDAASLFGVQLGPGEFKASMANGVAQIEPIDLTVSRGRVHLAPQLRLVPDLQLSLPKGPLAQQIQVDPSLCASTLKFLAPALAGVTTAQGSFTIELDDFNGKCIPCRIPLADPMKADLAGRLIIHSMDVGPGPMSSEMAVFLAKEAPAKLRPESVVAFQLLDGRIYHQGLELMFPDISIRTSGSVGLKDETLNLMAELPVPQKWLVANTALSQAMRNQVIRVPIAGTLAKPQLDQKVMQDLARQFAQNVEKAATGVIQGEVTKQLDRLFAPQK